MAYHTRVYLQRFCVIAQADLNLRELVVTSTCDEMVLLNDALCEAI